MGFLNTAANIRTSHHAAQASRKMDPKLSPARAAEINHENRYATMWVVFGIVAVPSLAIIGAGALWFLLPIGVLLAVVHVGGASAENAASPQMLAEQQARRTINAGVTMGVAGCTWCGSPGTHRDANGRPQHPREFHRAEIDTAVALKVAGGSRYPER